MSIDNISRKLEELGLSKNPADYFGIAGVRFPVEQFATRRIKSAEELADILSKFPAKKNPVNYGTVQRTPYRPEFVDMSKVVGGTGYDINEYKGTFASSKDEIGGESLYAIYLKLLGKQMSVAGVMPIELVEDNGDFYVWGDGHGRVSVLKATGVPIVPANVSHVSR